MARGGIVVSLGYSHSEFIWKSCTALRSLGIILYQLVYQHCPFAHLEPMQRVFMMNTPDLKIQCPRPARHWAKGRQWTMGNEMCIYICIYIYIYIHVFMIQHVLFMHIYNMYCTFCIYIYLIYIYIHIDMCMY